jgi:hypothetical protein
MNRDTIHRCHYARSSKENLLDDGVGYTLVSEAFDDVASISHGKRSTNLIKNLGLEIGIPATGQNAKAMSERQACC